MIMKSQIIQQCGSLVSTNRITSLLYLIKKIALKRIQSSLALVLLLLSPPVLRLANTALTENCVTTKKNAQILVNQQDVKITTLFYISFKDIIFNTLEVFLVSAMEIPSQSRSSLSQVSVVAISNDPARPPSYKSNYLFFYF